MKKTLLSFGLALLLTMSGFADARAGEEKECPAAANPVERLVGTVWQKSDQSHKEAFLFGVESAIALEYFINARMEKMAVEKGKKPKSVLSGFERGWMEAFKGVSRAEIAKSVDKWYAENPDKLDRPVLGVIWHEMIAPRLTREHGRTMSGQRAGG
ncbi:MAG: hypothetical protein LBR31_05635 [Desulfovibrio sp.]|jgi:hypothetical protein|nr:hypothetical protein [Desulfovibrio sp.]